MRRASANGRGGPRRFGTGKHKEGTPPIGSDLSTSTQTVNVPTRESTVERAIEEASLRLE